MKIHFKKHWEALNRSIYTGERGEKNLAALALFSTLTASFGALMTVLNIVQRKGFVTWTTLMFAVGGVVGTISARKYRNRDLSIVIAVGLTLMAFTYYAISGANDGFAILWTMLMPLAISYFMSVKYGIMISVYFELLNVILFYTPLRRHFASYYTVTFMNRYPIVYLCEVLMTAISMTQYHEIALLEIDYTDRLNAEVERQTRMATERADKLARLSEGMVETLARAIDAKDAYTNGHSFRVSMYSVALAEALGWDEEQVRSLRREAMLHDIGKIGVPDAVLNKPGRLTDEEFNVIKSHTTVGANILAGLEDMEAVAEVARCHHERYDGSGYPSGLAGEAIPEHARIVSIADAYDAMHSNRIYRRALTMEVIREEMARGRGRQFDPSFLDAFLPLIDSGQLDALDQQMDARLKRAG